MAKKSGSKFTSAKSSSGDILKILETRFNQNMQRHKGLKWADVEAKLKSNKVKLKVLSKMEETGGEPDVVGYDQKQFLFVDCSEQSPEGRRSFCYDRKALNSRKEHKPKNSAQDFAKELGAEMLTEEQYRKLQKLGEFDTKTSSWIQTPKEIRDLGGALFCDRRYNQVFTYHNGAESYYAVRGFRCLFKV